MCSFNWWLCSSFPPFSQPVVFSVVASYGCLHFTFLIKMASTLHISQPCGLHSLSLSLTIYWTEGAANFLSSLLLHLPPSVLPCTHIKDSRRGGAARWDMWTDDQYDLEMCTGSLSDNPAPSPSILFHPLLPSARSLAWCSHPFLLLFIPIFHPQFITVAFIAVNVTRANKNACVCSVSDVSPFPIMCHSGHHSADSCCTQPCLTGLMDSGT